MIILIDKFETVIQHNWPKSLLKKYYEIKIEFFTGLFDK